MTIKQLAPLLGVLLVSAQLSALGNNLPSAEALVARPNIVVIMVDDLNERSLDIMVQNGLMPNLKRHIIDKATTFSESFVTFPLCCPSRSTFLTGQYPHNHGVWGNELPDGGASKFVDSTTIATWLQEAGYHTGYVGKYLNMYGIDTPETYVPAGWDDWQATVGDSTYLMYLYTINDNGVLVTYGDEPNDYQTDVLAGRAAEFIQERESSDSTPFFLYVNPLAPHAEDSIPPCTLNYGILQATLPPIRYIDTTDAIEFPRPPSFNETDVSDKPSSLRKPPLNSTHVGCLENLFHDRLETMRAVDDLIQEVVSSLKDNKELWKTVIVFTSDNGFLLGERRLHGKNWFYEESIGVPLYIRIPNMPPQTIAKLVVNNDLAPTFLDLAQAQADIEIDGRSLLPLIENPNADWRNGFLIETLKYSAVRTEHYAYAFYYAYGAKEVYDLDNDPDQLKNVKSKLPWKSKIIALDEWREALRTCKGLSCNNIENRAPP
ncbi:MAG: sulfatase family protein [Nitrososphaerales archaeon]